MILKTSTWRLTAIALLALALCACGSNAPKRVEVEGAIVASAIINPDLSGEYRPVNVRVFFLKNDTAFSKADFNALYFQSDSVLGNDLVFVISKQVLPGQTIQLEEEIPQGAKFVGAIAAFRALDQSRWRDIKPLPEKCWSCRGVGLWNPVKVNLDRLTVELTLDD